MLSTSLMLPGSVTVLPETGSNGQWLNTNNVLLADGLWTEYQIPQEGTETPEEIAAGTAKPQKLLVRNFGYALPTNAVIAGMILKTRAYDNYGNLDLSFTLGFTPYLSSNSLASYQASDIIGAQKEIGTTYNMTHTEDPDYQPPDGSTIPETTAGSSTDWWPAQATTEIQGIRYTAVVGGHDGNNISIRYVNPGAANQALSITVSGTDITVNLATNSSGVITTLNTNLATAWAASSANSLATAVVHNSPPRGTALTAQAKTLLTGGSRVITGPMVNNANFGLILRWPLSNYSSVVSSYFVDYVKLQLYYYLRTPHTLLGVGP